MDGCGLSISTCTQYAVTDSDAQSYDLDPDNVPPELPGSVRVGEDLEETLDFIAADLFIQSCNCVRSFGDFHLALSHGQVQERLLIKLMVDPKYRTMPWSRTHLWSIAESKLEPGHPEHSMTHWTQIAVDAGGIPAAQVHCVFGHQPTGARLYADELTEHLEWRERGHDRLDFVLLGDEIDLIGGFDDPTDQLVSFTPCQSRIVMTRRLINSSRFIGILGVGQSGRALVDVVGKDHREIGLSPAGGVMRWYLDGYACRHTQDLYINEESS